VGEVRCSLLNKLRPSLYFDCQRCPLPWRDVTTVLVVDDQAFVRKTIRSMLADKTGWILCEAQNGKVAVDLAKKKCPDVVVLDLVMPVMGGLAAAYEIGKIAPQTKIVFISSHYTLGQAAGLDRLFGAAHFVQKSEMGKELIPAIKKLLRA
jgi:two-component system chemotaxis response regulator CheY